MHYVWKNLTVSRNVVLSQYALAGFVTAHAIALAQYSAYGRYSTHVSYWKDRKFTDSSYVGTEL